jgi:alkanesulfonate monooxygenase SsuD/methylene tetrahydromethanopterin reductase-like flavin-dependent oxidoreductase (luciferase family)
MQERFERLEEALRFLRAAFTPGANGFEGTHYRLDEVEVLPVPTNLRIMIGGGGPRKTPTLAGRYGDEYNQFVDPPDKLAPRFDVFREAAIAAGRNPDDIVISVVFQSVMGGDEAAYRRRLEADAASRDMSPDDYAARLAGRGMPHGAPEQVRETVRRLADLGVSRLYIQLVNPLGEVDLDRLEESFAILRG